MNSLLIGIISDQRLVRQALFCLLSTFSFGCALSLTVDADNVNDADEEISLSKPQVLIIDCDGAEDSLQSVRSVLDLSPSTKSLLLAADPSEVFAIKAVQNGAWGIVGKQSEPALLQQAIEKLVNGEVWFSHRTIGNALHACANQERSSDSGFDQLTPREIEVLMLLSKGLCNKEIAAQLFLTESTVKAHVRAIYRKLGVNSRVKAAALSYAERV